MATAANPPSLIDPPVQFVVLRPLGGGGRISLLFLTMFQAQCSHQNVSKRSPSKTKALHCSKDR